MNKHKELILLAERILTLMGLIGEVEVKAKTIQIKLDDIQIILKTK